MSRPVIGICAGLEKARWGVWDQPAALLPLAYLQAIQRAGGIALMLPPDAHLTEAPEQVLDLIHRLILAGGADIDPSSYDQPAHPETHDTVPERDAFEISLARAALALDMPLLGICRGMQLLNVVCGGTLAQHLPELLGHGEHRRVPGSFDGAEHDVTLENGSLAERSAGERTHSTRSHHHQGVDCLGAGLIISGASDLDGLPEAIELPDKEFALGVQWHPEADPGSSVIGALVQAAGRFALADARR